MNLDDMIGADKPFQHVAESAKGLVDTIDGVALPPYQLRKTSVATGRDFIQVHFNSKGYSKPVLAGECILMGMITGCTHIRRTHFRGSEDGDKAVALNLKTGAAAVDADGNELLLEKCILEQGEAAAAFPASNVYLTRVDCKTLDQDGVLTGVPLILEAEGIATGDCFETRAMGQMPGSSCWAIVLVPSADVPDLASVWIDVEIGNGFAR